MDLWSAYDEMGSDYERHAADSAYNAHYDRPAVLAALGPVTGRRVLDAACGPGLYAESLLAAGAEVVCFDASQAMVDLARQRLGQRAQIDLVVSTQHPTVDWLRKGGSYFDTVLETDTWRLSTGDQEVRFWREPLSRLCAAATSAGFVIDQLIEPRPAESMRELFPNDYDTLHREPGFLILSLRKMR